MATEVDLEDDEIESLIIASKAMLEGMMIEGSERPPSLIKAHDKLVLIHNLRIDLDGN